jgi:hypothetical protein
MQSQSCCNGSKSRVAPDPEVILRSQNSSSSYAGVQKSVSQESKKRRKKPLAVAVGYNNAVDMDGRPIVITPGTRKIPIDLVKASSRSSRNSKGRQSPVSVPTTATGESSERRQLQASA